MKKISKRAFKGCSNLSSITISDGITEIDIKTFEDCRSLKEISIPQTVTSINKEAFRGCKCLKKVIMPEGQKSQISTGYITRFGIRSIDDEAFRDCSALKEITLPSTIANLGSYVFRDCTALQIIHCKAVQPPFCLPKTFHWADNLEVIVPAQNKESYQKAYGWCEVMSERVDEDEVNPSVTDLQNHKLAEAKINNLCPKSITRMLILLMVPRLAMERVKSAI